MRYLRILIIVIFALATATASADALLDSARTHIDAGNPELAWKILAPLNSERAGDVEFDYLLGLAALDTGRRTEAVFALERVLAVEPEHAEARAEIARAYFELNELRRAKAEFDQVLQDESVPAEARLEIGKFLSAIETVESDDKTAWNANVSVSIGDDDNVNVGPQSSNIAVPVFGGAIITLDKTALPVESTFVSTRFRGNVKHKLRKTTQLLAGFGAASRRNSETDAERFDFTTLDYNLGVRFLRSRFSHFTLSLVGQNFDLDGDPYRDVIGLLGQWRQRISSNREISLYGKLAEIEFDGQSARDADRKILGGGFSQFFPGKRNPLLYIGFYIGDEETQKSTSTNLGFDFIGLRVGGQVKLSDRNILFASLSRENREYADADPFFLKTRDDDLTAATLGLRYRYSKNWSFSPEINWGENDSNIELNDNDRTRFVATARYDF